MVLEKIQCTNLGLHAWERRHDLRHRALVAVDHNAQGGASKP